MKDEYDFSKAERGRFLKKDVAFNLPVYLDEDNRAFLEKVAQRKNIDVSMIVNDLIRLDRKILKTVE